MIKSIEVPASNTVRELQVKAKSYIRFSNNITSINVVSTLNDANIIGPGGGLVQQGSIDKSQLTKFSAGSNVKVILPSCFIECKNLSSVSFAGELEAIGDYAFYGCTSLSNVSLLERDWTAENVGRLAFAKTGMRSAKFGSRSSPVFQPFLGERTFASCYNLEEFYFIDQNTMTDYMLEGCSSLTSVTFAQKTNNVAPGAFSECTSLKRMSMPADTYSVPAEFAKGCTSLTSFSFQQPGNLAFSQSLGNRMLSGAPLTSLEFPRSLKSFNVFSSKTLEGLDDLKEIHFTGMTYDQIAEAASVNSQGQSIVRYSTKKIYYEQSLNDLMLYCGIYGAEKDAMFIEKSADELCQIAKDCIDNNVPLLVFNSGSDVEHYKRASTKACIEFASNILNSDAFKNFVQTNDKCVIIYSDKFPTTTFYYGTYDSFYSFAGMTYKANKKGYVTWLDSNYVVQLMTWKKPNTGTVKRQHDQQVQVNTNKKLKYESFIETVFLKRINDFFAECPPYTQSIDIHHAVPTIMTTNCFGLNHDVKLFGHDNRCLEFKSNSSGGSIMYNQVVQVDAITTNDFRYGQWYAKARFLKSYADINYIPVFAIATRGNSYKNSTIFNSAVFNTDEFQDYITRKKFFLCKIDSSTYSSQNSQFLLNTWMNKSSFQSRLPLIMMYWVKKDGGTAYLDPDDPSTKVIADITFKNLAYFSASQSDAQIGDVKCVHNYDELTSWVESLNQYKEYVPDSKFDRPEISSYLQSYPKYKVYADQLNDDYGRYYPVAKLSSPDSLTYDISVNNDAGQLTKYTIHAGQTQNLPLSGTYQYFSLPKTDYNESFYENYYQVSGLIFKVGQQYTSKVAYHDEYQYGMKTYPDILALCSISQADIQRTASYFNTDIYEYDANGDPTTQIDTSMTAGMPFLWNNLVTLTLNDDTQVGAYKMVYSMQLWLSSQAQLTTITTQYDNWKELVPGDTQYVISVQFLRMKPGDNQVLWTRPFMNA